tara:strand:- start:1847 stop:2089 length:243 start_codon:yes stop_codon:yes gene_type:complete
MKNYKKLKEANKVSIANDNGVIKITKKSYDIGTGEELDDVVEMINPSMVTDIVSDIDAQITSLTKEKADYEQLKTDYEAL